MTFLLFIQNEWCLVRSITNHMTFNKTSQEIPIKLSYQARRVFKIVGQELELVKDTMIGHPVIQDWSSVPELIRLNLAPLVDGEFRVVKPEVWVSPVHLVILHMVPEISFEQIIVARDNAVGKLPPDRQELLEKFLDARRVNREARLEQKRSHDAFWYAMGSIELTSCR